MLPEIFKTTPKGLLLTLLALLAIAESVRRTVAVVLGVRAWLAAVPGKVWLAAFLVSLGAGTIAGYLSVRIQFDGRPMPFFAKQELALQPANPPAPSIQP